jgi:uncharacterized protein
MLINSLAKTETELTVCDEYGRTALHYAAGLGYADVAEVLLNGRASVNARDRYEFTALHLAASYGHVDLINLLLANGALNLGGQRGKVPLHLAASQGRESAVEALLNRGMSINELDAQKGTALHYAAWGGYANVMKLLLKRGALNLPDQSDMTPLHVAAKKGRTSTVAALIEGGALKDEGGPFAATALHYATEAGRLSVVEILMNGGAPINAQDKDGDTALHLTAAAGQVEIVQALLKAKADTTVRNINGDRAVCVSARKKHFDITTLLIEEQGNVGRTMHYYGKEASYLTLQAARIGDSELAKILVEEQSKFPQDQIFGKSSLHLAAWSGDVTSLKVLLDVGLQRDINEGDEDGSTALHLAAHNGCVETVKVLLAADAERDKADAYGWTACRRAALNRHTEILKLLDVEASLGRLHTRDLILKDRPDFKESEAGLSENLTAISSQSDDDVKNSWHRSKVTFSVVQNLYEFDWDRPLGEGAYGVVVKVRILSRELLIS